MGRIAPPEAAGKDVGVAGADAGRADGRCGQDLLVRWGIGSSGEGGGISEIQGIGRDEWLKDKKLDFLKQKDYH